MEQQKNEVTPMTKIYIKLIAMALALILSVSVVIMSSYAWMVLSGNPAVSGIQVAIGGGNTILIAPNLNEEAEDGTLYNYPGYFSDKMNFAMHDSYDYLSDLGGLSPVSTSNGIDWFLSEKKIDSFLEYANLPSGDEKLEDGSYIYLDFWVVSPSGDYTLRVSSGDEDSGGSFVMDILSVEQSDNETGYTLAEPESKAAAAVRIGFLANDTQLTDDTMKYYTESYYFDERFTALKGWYQEPNTGTIYLESDRFTIYEPNGDSHPANPEFDGSYVQTFPRSTDENYDPWSNLTVQLSSGWSLSEIGSKKIEEQFRTYLTGKEFADAQEAMNGFYGSYLQGVIAPYVTKGRFIDNSSNLETLVKVANLKEYALKNSLLKGATEDTYIIKLEQNVPQRIRMFVWIEAADMDCEAIKNTASFAVNIELAGGNE